MEGDKRVLWKSVVGSGGCGVAFWKVWGVEGME